MPAPQEGRRIRGEHSWHKGLWRVGSLSRRKACTVASHPEAWYLGRELETSSARDPLCHFGQPCSKSLGLPFPSIKGGVCTPGLPLMLTSLIRRMLPSVDR